MTGKTLAGTFWDAGDISLLDLGTNDSGVFTIENSLNYTFSFLYVPYTSIYTFTHFKANYRQFFSFKQVQTESRDRKYIRKEHFMA